jgi:hypothetical protein
MKLVFKEGGAFEFYNMYTALLDRLQAMQDEGGPVEHLEDLPVYSTDGVAPPALAAEPVDELVSEREDVPDDMPPAYDDVASDDDGRGRSRTRF